MTATPEAAAAVIVDLADWRRRRGRGGALAADRDPEPPVAGGLAVVDGGGFTLARFLARGRLVLAAAPREPAAPRLTLVVAPDDGRRRAG